MGPMDCDCQWLQVDLLTRYQYISDFFIALAYFSIPLELIYFVKKSAVFPYRWVLVQFGAFIVLCGATHLINLWMFGPYSQTVAAVMTSAKILTAVVSCATALMLVHIIPDLLSVKTRELFLKNKAAELDREMGMIRTQEETGRHVRMLTQEIRSTLDRHTILNTTFVELGKTLALEECALWMPTRNGLELQLSHTLQRQTPVAMTVPVHHPTIKGVFSSHRAVVLSPNSPVAMVRPITGKYVLGDVVGMRVPLLHLNNFHIKDWPDPSKRPYALMVLMLPSDSARRWHAHELELVEVVAEQVAVALSHAAILEESMKASDLLYEQNVALDMARREAETAVRAKNDFLAVMNHEMRTPTHAITAFSSLLWETDLNVEQRSMVETIIKSSNLLATLINDVLDLSRLEDGSLELDVRDFNIASLFREVLNLVKPIALLKKLSVSLYLDPDVPERVKGDDKRLMQSTLNVIGNAIKFTKEGNVDVIVCKERKDYLRDPPVPDFRPVYSDNFFYLRVQVRDTGIGVKPQDIPKLFNKSVQSELGPHDYYATGLGLAICKRFVNLMDGHIWIESQGLGKGTTVTFIVKLQLSEQCLDTAKHGVLASSIEMGFTGLKVILVEENMINRMATKALLDRLGCDVIAVSSGRDGLLVFSECGKSAKVLIVDASTPDADGFEMVSTLKGKVSLQAERTFVVGVISSTDSVSRARCLSAGMDGVLLKPFSLEKVRDVLNELFSKGRPKSSGHDQMVLHHSICL